VNKAEKPLQTPQIAEPPPVPLRTTGISGLDFQLGGGFPAGTTIIVWGSVLTGIDKMAKQFWKAEESEGTYFMFDSLVEEGMIDAAGMKPADLVKQMDADRIVIDSLSTLIQEYGIDDIVTFIRECNDIVRKRSSNMMMVFYDQVHTTTEIARIYRAADVFVSLREEAHGNEIERKLAIHKIPYRDVPRRLWPYNIMEEGLELSTTARVV
jgi:archaellum biogenesis ATPase FlaH